MSTSVIKFLSCIIYLLAANAIFAQSNGFSDVLKYYETSKNFNGAVLIATNGHIDYLHAVGLSGRQLQTRMTPQSKFKIASVTKTFTAVLVLQLWQDGKINLQETIGKYLPEYKGDGRNTVTIENLLTYSSGIPNADNYGGLDIYQKAISVDSFILRYCSGNLTQKAGSKFNYGNGEYIILGRIIEKITGKSFAQNLNDKIIKPLGMVNTNMLATKDVVPGLVSTYSYSDSIKVFYADEPYYIENFFSAGAMYSTVEDLLKLDRGIFEYTLLSKKTVDVMVKPFSTLDNVALGFWVAEKYGTLNTKFAYRPGGIFGATANWVHVFDSNKVIIVCSNTDATNLFDMTQQLYLVATGKKATLPLSLN